MWENPFLKKLRMCFLTNLWLLCRANQAYYQHSKWHKVFLAEEWNWNKSQQWQETTIHCTRPFLMLTVKQTQALAVWEKTIFHVFYFIASGKWALRLVQCGNLFWNRWDYPRYVLKFSQPCFIRNMGTIKENSILQSKLSAHS